MRKWLHSPASLTACNPKCSSSTRPTLTAMNHTRHTAHSACCASQGQCRTVHAHQGILHTSSCMVGFLSWTDWHGANNINLLGKSTHQCLKEKAFWSSPNTHKNALCCTALAHLCNWGRADTTHRAWISSFSLVYLPNTKLFSQPKYKPFMCCFSLSSPHFTA